MHPDEIERGWSEAAYVWVRPAEGTDWEQAIDRRASRGDREWRPALMVGFTDDKWAYNTHNDPRRFFLIGSSYCYALTKFEIGGLIEDFAPDAVNRPTATTPANSIR